jgi:molybdenum cofactor cytidylyltransferase
VAGPGAVKLAAVVLAAGRAERFGADKRLARFRDRPLIEWALAALAGFDFAQKICVVRDDDPIGDVARRYDIAPVVNDRAAEGMGTSLACGVAALGEVDGAFIVLADMPDIPPGLHAAMAARFAEGDADIVVPRHAGRAGHPVLFGAACFTALKALTGDRGGRSLIDQGRYRTVFLDVDSGGVLRDIDRPADID